MPVRKENEARVAPSKPVILEVSRGFDAPAERVFDAWLDPASAGRWLFATPTGEMQRVEIVPRVGGKFVIAEKRGETLAEHFGTYLEIDRPRRLVFSFATNLEEKPTRVTVEFTPAGAGGCAVKLSHEMDPEWAAFAERATAGWNMILEGLGSKILGEGANSSSNPIGSESEREIVSVRIFDAPRELVWKAWTEPEHLARWWGPKGFTNTFHEFDLRPGGVWRFVMHGPDGTDYKNKSVFVEIVPPERLVFDHVSGHFFRVTATLEAIGAKTKVTFRMVFDWAEELDRVRHVVVPGNEQNFDKLAAELARMA